MFTVTIVQETVICCKLSLYITTETMSCYLIATATHFRPSEIDVKVMFPTEVKFYHTLLCVKPPDELRPQAWANPVMVYNTCRAPILMDIQQRMMSNRGTSRCYRTISSSLQLSAAVNLETTSDINSLVLTRKYENNPIGVKNFNVFPMQRCMHTQLWTMPMQLLATGKAC